MDMTEQLSTQTEHSNRSRSSSGPCSSITTPKRLPDSIHVAYLETQEWVRERGQGGYKGALGVGAVQTPDYDMFT